MKIMQISFQMRLLAEASQKKDTSKRVMSLTGATNNASRRARNDIQEGHE